VFSKKKLHFDINQVAIEENTHYLIWDLMRWSLIEKYNQTTLFWGIKVRDFIRQGKNRVGSN
jgi:hypothetical protein